MLNAKKKFDSRESRGEDISLIERLEDQYNQRTQQLLLITKDLTEYKNRMKIQESEVNARFGVLPSIAPTVPKSGRISGRKSLGTLPKLTH